MGQKKESWECTKRRFVLGCWKQPLALLPQVIAAVVRTANQMASIQNWEMWPCLLAPFLFAFGVLLQEVKNARKFSLGN